MFGPGWFATKARAARRLIQGVARLKGFSGLPRRSSDFLPVFGRKSSGPRDQSPWLASLLKSKDGRNVGVWAEGWRNDG